MGIGVELAVLEVTLPVLETSGELVDALHGLLDLSDESGAERGGAHEYLRR